MMCISVLIVDDNPETRRLLRIILDDPRILIVGEARDGHEALRQFQNLLPDVVVMGLHMPGRNGIKVTEQMRQIEPDAKIIILSIESDQSYRRRAVEAGASDYIVKPPDPDELRASIFRFGRKQGKDPSDGGG
jgi:YesN/AraC family two-component response regulator